MRDQKRRLGRRQTGRLLAEIGEAGGAHAFEIAAERRQRHVDRQHVVLAQALLQAQRLGDLDEFRRQRPRPPFEQADRLHRQGRGAGDDAAVCHELADGAQHRGRIDAGMGVEPSYPRRRRASVGKADRRDRPPSGRRHLSSALRKPRRIEPSRARTSADRSRLRSSAGSGSIQYAAPRTAAATMVVAATTAASRPRRLRSPSRRKITSARP